MLSGQLFSNNKNDSFRIHMDEAMAVYELAKQVYSYLPKCEDQEIAVICIGSDRSTGDSLGPLIGSKLLENNCRRFSVYGTLDQPVHAKNLEETLLSIEKNSNRPFIIGVDACLGRSTSVGFMTVAEGALKPGSAVNKSLPPVGDIHLTGIVNVNGFMELMVLQNTRLAIVMNMANIISKALARSARWLETSPHWLDKGIYNNKSV